MPVISESKREQIIEFLKNNLSQREISRRLNLSLCGVQKVIMKHKRGFGIRNLPKPGRPEKLKKIQKRNLIIHSKREPTKSARELRNDCGLEQIVSNDTVRRILRKNNFHGRIAAVKPHLTNSLRRRRKQWCLKHAKWTKENWNKIIFSDESRIELFPRCRNIVRRPKGSNRYDKKYVVPSKKFSPSLMVWGAIRSDGKRVLLRCTRNVDQHYYQELLSKGLSDVYNTRFIFQQDGATSHTAKTTKEFLVQEGVRCLSD